MPLHYFSSSFQGTLSAEVGPEDTEETRMRSLSKQKHQNKLSCTKAFTVKCFSVKADSSSDCFPPSFPDSFPATIGCCSGQVLKATTRTFLVSFP